MNVVGKRTTKNRATNARRKRPEKGTNMWDIMQRCQKTHHNGMENEYKIAAGAMSNNFY